MSFKSLVSALALEAFLLANVPNINGEGAALASTVYNGIVVGNTDGPVQLLLDDGSGNGSFAVTELVPPGSCAPFGLSVADVNGDDELDIALACINAENLLLLKDSTGGYTTQLLPGGPSPSTSISVVDIDVDGDMDIVVTNLYLAGNQILFNDGNLNFNTAITEFAANSFSQAVGDLNGDGLPDIVFGLTGFPTIIVFNDGADFTSFTNTTLLLDTIETPPLSFLLMDINDDGHLDVVQGESTSSDRIFFNDGNGNFDSDPVLLPDSDLETQSMVVGDFDDDGDLDIAIGIYDGANKLLLNDGTGTFISTDLPGGVTKTTSIALGDVDGDGLLDIVVGNDGQANTLLLNTGTPGQLFSATELPGGSLSTWSIALLIPPAMTTTTTTVASTTATSPQTTTAGTTTVVATTTTGMTSTSPQTTTTVATTTTGMTSTSPQTTTAGMTTPTTEINLFYPDWAGKDTCLNDGNAPPYMKLNPTSWMVLTLDECCTRYYGWSYDECMGTSGVSTGLYFPDWDVAESIKCIASNDEPKYMKNNADAWMYETVEKCCARYFGWSYYQCVENSGGIGETPKWYVDWEKSVCVKNCVETDADVNCGGLAKSYDQFFDSDEQCCSLKLSWKDRDECTVP